MKTRKILLAVITVLIISSGSLFASGMSETATLTSPMIAGAGGGALTGAAIGSIVPGLGTAIGALVGFVGGGIAGLITGLGNVFSNREKQESEYETAYQNALTSYYSADSDVTEAELGITETEESIRQFDEALLRWQANYELEEAQLESSAESQYQELYSNWQGVELSNVEKGQSGGSADLIALQAQSQVVNLVGADLTLDLSGGLYGQTLNEFYADAIAGRTELLANRTVQKSALATYQENLSKATQNRTNALQSLNTAEQKTGRTNSTLVDGKFTLGTKS